MKNTLRQLFHSGKFVVGFTIFAFLVLMVIFFPMLVKDPPLVIIGQGTFFPPGIYVSVYDSLSSPAYTLKIEGASESRIASKLSEEDRSAIKEYLVAAVIPESAISKKAIREAS
jgi:peptide/nickel transport system permease protein